MAEPPQRVKFIRYTDQYISLDLYTPVDVDADMTQRYHFYQQDENQYRLNLWYNQ